MSPILNYIKIIGYIIIVIFILTFIMTILNYYDILSNNIMNYYKFIIILITTFIGGISIGRQATKKGWLNGLKLGLLMVFLLYLFSYLGLDKATNIKNIIYYLIIILITTIGGMFGINKKKQED